MLNLAENSSAVLTLGSTWQGKAALSTYGTASGLPPGRNGPVPSAPSLPAHTARRTNRDKAHPIPLNGEASRSMDTHEDGSLLFQRDAKIPVGRKVN